MRKLFKERKLFKGGNYMRKYGSLNFLNKQAEKWTSFYFYFFHWRPFSQPIERKKMWMSKALVSNLCVGVRPRLELSPWKRLSSVFSPLQVKETGMTFYLSAQKVRQPKVVHPKHYKNLNQSFGGWAVLKIPAILLSTFARFLSF